MENVSTATLSSWIQHDGKQTDDATDGITEGVDEKDGAEQSVKGRNLVIFVSFFADSIPIIVESNNFKSGV